MIYCKKQILTALAFLIFIQFLSAQVTITVPSGNPHNTGLTNSIWRKPLGTYFGYERSAMIFAHGEIGQYGTITSLGFYCDSVNTPGKVPLTIYMKEVTGTYFTNSTYPGTEESGAQVVYADTIQASSFSKGQWVTVNLTNPFTHATANSVEIIVETNAGGTGNEGSLAKGFYHSLTSFSTLQFWSADNAAPNNLGTLTSYRPNITIGLTPITSCTGAPFAGTTVSSVDTTCSSVSLSLNGTTAATGLTYQWQDSISGGGWANKNGANTSTLVANISASTWFRCKVNCGTQSAFSTLKEVVIRNYMQCYCFNSLGGGCGTSAIDSVAIENTTLLNPASGCSVSGYTQYPATSNYVAQLTPGQNYNLHTRFNGIVIASVWLDYDQSGSFDSSEWKQICGTAKIDSDYVTVLSVPAGAKNGLTLMRIRSRSTGNLNGYGDACTNFGSGETEDYFIGINYDVAVANKQQDHSLILFPNPANDRVMIKGITSLAETSIVIESVDGKIIGEAKNYASESYSIDVSSFPVGLYFVKVSGDGFTSCKKLIINR